MSSLHAPFSSHVVWKDAWLVSRASLGVRVWPARLDAWVCGLCTCMCVQKCMLEDTLYNARVWNSAVHRVHGFVAAYC